MTTPNLMVLAVGAAALGALGLGACSQDTTTALGTTENCWNGTDDDDNGLVDCADPACNGHAACTDRLEFSCDNGVDDDGDGAVDCDDPDCQDAQACNPDKEVSCADNEDNDGDGQIDCDDSDCQGTPDCEERCDDGIDNDHDGLVDCADPSCAEKPSCQVGREQLCDNGDDDDGDGLIDCDDPDCLEAPACAPPVVEICDDHVDNDSDGQTDCDDSDCVGEPSCVEQLCWNGGDDDHDGLVDCEDADCLTDPFCAPDPTCTYAQTIGCNESVLSSTRGRPNSISAYGGDCSVTDMHGGEQIYFLDPTASGYDGMMLITLWSPDSGPPLDLLVIGSHNGGCSSENSCQIAGNSGSDGTRVIDLYPPPGGTTGVYIVVDSQNAQGGPFALSVDCSQMQGEICNDRQDNDGDGLEDCWDPDCQDDPACDYWVSGGVACNPSNPDSQCAPGEFCHAVIVGGGTTFTQGVCTRSCDPLSGPPGDCWNPQYGYGACHSTQNNEHICVQECGIQNWSTWTPEDCPEGTQCTDHMGSQTSLFGSCLPLY